jgi:hypothetical protein
MVWCWPREPTQHRTKQSGKGARIGPLRALQLTPGRRARQAMWPAVLTCRLQQRNEQPQGHVIATPGTATAVQTTGANAHMLQVFCMSHSANVSYCYCDYKSGLHLIQVVAWQQLQLLHPQSVLDCSASLESVYFMISVQATHRPLCAYVLLSIPLQKNCHCPQRPELAGASWSMRVRSPPSQVGRAALAACTKHA